MIDTGKTSGMVTVATVFPHGRLPFRSCLRPVFALRLLPVSVRGVPTTCLHSNGCSLLLFLPP